MTRVNQTTKAQYIYEGIKLATNILIQTGFLNSIWANQTATPQAQTPTNTLGETVAKPEENTPQKTDDEIKTEITNVLKDNNIYTNFESQEGKDIINITFNKYNAIKAVNPDITDSELSIRLCNYVKGYLYHQKENQFGLQSLAEESGEKIEVPDEIISEDVKEAIKTKDNDLYKESFLQLGKEYVEFYDTNENGIEVDEFIRVEVAETERELGRKLTKEESEAIQEMALQKFTHLNVNKDKVLDEAEIAGYIWARNIYNDNDASNMTYADFNSFETALYGDMTLTAEQKQQAAECQQILKQHNLKINTLPDNLSNLGLSETEINVINQGIEPLKIILKMSTVSEAIKNGYEGLM